MKKFIVLAVIVLLGVAGWAGATYFVGANVQSRYTGLIDQYGHFGPFTLTIQSYDKGFLESKAQTVVEIRVPQSPSEDGQENAEDAVSFVFEHTFRHGPLPLGASGQQTSGPALALVETRLVSFSADEEDFEKLLAEIPALAEPFAFSKIALDGSVQSRVTIPAFENQSEGNLVRWGGFTLESQAGPDLKTLVGTFDMPKMELIMADGRLTWNGISGRFDLAETLPMLYVGTSRASFGVMDMSFIDKQSGQLKTMQMKGFEVASDSSVDGTLVRYEQTLEFGGVTVEGETFGPGVLEIEMNNLDGEALSSFQGHVQDLYRDSDSFNPEELVGRMLPLYLQLFQNLAAGNPELTIRKLHFATPQGDVDGRVRVKLDGNADAAAGNPAALLQSLDAEADLSVAESLARSLAKDTIRQNLMGARERGDFPPYSDEEIANLVEQQVDGQIDGLLAQNFLVSDGANLKASATFSNGELVLNGTLLPLFQGQ
ncbi:MAG: YdgA family protein [Desulfuromonadales bacterium]